MKKIATTLSCLMLMTQLSFGQSREDDILNPIAESKVLLGFKVGPSIALGEFSKIAASSEKAGLAKTGIQLNANLRYLLTKSFYLIIEAGYSSNPIDEDELGLPIKKLVASNVSVSVASKSWSAKTFNVGAGTRTAIDVETYFLTKFAIGLQNMASPSYIVTLSNGQTTQLLHQSSSTANALNFTLGASIMTKINPTTHFSIGLDYLTAMQDFEGIAVNSSINGSSAGPTEFFDSSQNIETISITIGVYIKI